MIATTTSKFGTVKTSTTDYDWKTFQQYNFTGNLFPIHYYTIIDSNKNNFKTFFNKYVTGEKITLKSKTKMSDGNLEEAFCKLMKTGMRFDSGFYDEKLLEVKKKRLFFRQRCKFYPLD